MQKTGAVYTRRTALTLLATTGVLLTTSLVTTAHAADKSLTVGFTQVSVENEWRTANSEPIKSTVKAQDASLKLSDAQRKQENQIKAAHSYIVQKVDVIAFSPVVESGWDTMLQGAKATKIPTVLTDRGIDSGDTWLYATFVSSDFVEEGCGAGRWLLENVKPKGDVNIVELQDIVGSTSAIDRKCDSKEITRADPHCKIIRSQTDNSTRAKGREVVETLLKAKDKKINVLYAYNDDMAIGTIQAVEEAGLKSGKDIIIISIDSVEGALEAMMAGKLNVTVEHSPLPGSQLMDTACAVLAGKTVPKHTVTREGISPVEVAVREFPNRRY